MSSASTSSTSPDPSPPRSPLPPNLSSSAPSLKPPPPPTSVHPLLPPLSPSIDALRALDAAHHADLPGSSSSGGGSTPIGQRGGAGGGPGPSPSPEKCLTFCSQRDNAPPLCRMLCLRRRTPAPTRQEALARLRPPSKEDRDGHRDRLVASATATATASTSTVASISSPSRGTISDTIASSVGDWWKSFHPFDTLRRKVEPYSIVYARGTPDGIVGRYMEELEFDDGNYDFGAISPGGEALGKRRRAEDKLEWMDWGENGSLLHLPLTTLLHPILSIPLTLNWLLCPPLNFLSTYRTSFSDGSQRRGLDKFVSEAERGGAFEMFGKIQGFLIKRANERREEEQRARKETQERVGEAQAEGGLGTGGAGGAGSAGSAGSAGTRKERGQHREE